MTMRTLVFHCPKCGKDIEEYGAMPHGMVKPVPAREVITCTCEACDLKRREQYIPKSRTLTATPEKERGNRVFGKSEAPNS